MTGDELPDADHVVRNVRGTSVFEDGTVNGSEFRLRPNRPDDLGVSVNWLEHFEGLDKDAQLAEIQRLRRMTVRKSWRMAELNVGATKAHLRERLPEISIHHAPIEATDAYEADDSHSEIGGLPAGDSEEAELIGDMIAQCIIELHPAIVE